MLEQFAFSPQFTSALAHLGVALDDRQIARLGRLGLELLHGNQRVNLTRITDPAEIEVKHVLDSLACVPLIRERMLRERIDGGPARLVDVGAGAGFPGLPLAIALPELEVTLVEATGKKVDFIAHAIEVLGITNARAVHARAEEHGRDPLAREAATLATARAIASVGVLCELTLPLVKNGGWAMLWKTASSVANEVAGAQVALVALGGRVETIADVGIPGVLDGRVAVLIAKTAPTPDLYPRRSGIPQRRPLGNQPA